MVGASQNHYLIQVETTRTVSEWVAVPVGEPSSVYQMITGLFFLAACFAGFMCAVWLTMRILWALGDWINRSGDNGPSA